MTTATYILHTVAGRRHFSPTANHAHSSVMARVADKLATWQNRAAERRQLLEMDDRLLQDMGISRADAFKEASKPFWQA